MTLKYFIVLVLFFLTSCDFKNSKSDVKIINDESYQREIIDVSFEEVKLSDSVNEMVFNPQILKIFNNEVYVADYAEMIVYRFNKNGEFISKIGKGIGRGPGQIQQIMDFHVTDEKLYLSDLNNFKISIYSNDGNHLRDVATALRPTRLVIDKNSSNEIIYINPLPSEHIIARLNTSGEVVAEIGNLIEDQLKHSIKYTGNFSKTADFILFTIYESSKILAISDDKVSKIINGPDGIDFPKTVTKTSRNETITNQIWQEPVAVSRSEFLVASTLSEELQIYKDSSITVLDFYKVSDFEYQHSIILPKTLHRWKSIENRLFYLDTDKGIIGAYDFNLSD